MMCNQALIYALIYLCICLCNYLICIYVCIYICLYLSIYLYLYQNWMIYLTWCCITELSSQKEKENCCFRNCFLQDQLWNYSFLIVALSLLLIVLVNNSLCIAWSAFWNSSCWKWEAEVEKLHVLITSERAEH